MAFNQGVVGSNPAWCQEAGIGSSGVEHFILLFANFFIVNNYINIQIWPLSSAG